VVDDRCQHDGCVKHIQQTSSEDANDCCLDNIIGAAPPFNDTFFYDMTNPLSALIPIPQLADYYSILFPRCLSIFCTPPPNKRQALTSLSVLYRAPIVSLWTSNVLDAFKLPPCSVMRSQWFFADHAMLCCASLREAEPDLLRDAVTERRLIRGAISVNPNPKCIESDMS